MQTRFLRKTGALALLASVCVMLMLAPAALAAKKEFTVYVAASMTKPAKALADKFNAEHDDMEIVLNIGSSGELLTKMEMAKLGDFFVPASDSFLQQALEKDLITESEPFIQQWPVFCVSKSGAEQIKTFDDLAKPGLKIAVGNPKTTALGQTWAMIETKLPAEQAKAIRANMTVEAAQANQVVQYINTDVISAGLSFDSIAKANGFTYVEIPADVNQPDTAHLAVLKFSQHTPEDIAKVRQYIMENIDIFEKAGYSHTK